MSSPPKMSSPYQPMSFGDQSMSFGAFLGKLGRVRLIILGVAVLLAPVSESAAQAEWQRTVKVIAPIEDGLVTRALTDSVVEMAETQNMELRRTPQSDTTTTPEKIKAALSEEGLALTSATHAFITYRFTQKSGQLHRNILDLHFIYRPTGEQGEDIPILYLDLSEEDLYRQLLVKKGTPSPVNEVAFRPFEEQISLYSLRDTARVVQVGNQIIREPERAAAEKRQIMATIRKLTYN